MDKNDFCFDKRELFKIMDYVDNKKTADLKKKPGKYIAPARHFK